MCMDDSPNLLTNDGFEHFKKKYEKEIDAFIEDMTEQVKQEKINEQKIISEYLAGNESNDQHYIPPQDADEMPFR